ncbi:MAG: hypothetical protein QOG94_384 [Solirubrobacteraceae bacterium]|jgi:hypothetical protein|nr:hypothetical protein [Solirubrobacteraceae bacterium]
MPSPKPPSEPPEPSSRPGRKPSAAAAAAAAAAAGAPTGYGAVAGPVGAGVTTTTTGGGGWTGGTVLDFPCFEALEGIQFQTLCTSADAYYESIFERIGAFRAIDELVKRFLAGLNFDFGGQLRNRLNDYMRDEPLRVSREDRQRVLGPFGDVTLERLLVRLSDAVIAFDLSRQTNAVAISASTLPQAAAQLDVIAALEDLELFLDGAGGGGVSFITDEVGKQLIEILNILNDPELRCHVPGNDIDDVFAVIGGLLAQDKDRPMDWQARQLARQACSGRQLFNTLATHVQSVDVDTTSTGIVLADSFAQGDLDTIIGLVYEWRAAHNSVSPQVVDATVMDKTAAAEERQLNVIRLRRAY